jgi:hypothetical protein
MYFGSGRLTQSNQGDMMKKLVTAIYYDAATASRVVDNLLASGVDRDRISILTTEGGGARHFAIKPGTKAAEGAAAGGAIGGALGLLVGGLVTAASAGVGVLATGPIMVGLAGLGAGAAAGGLAGALAGLGIPEAEAKFYEREIREKDAVLLGVEVDDENRHRISRIVNEPVDAHPTYAA